MSASMGMGMRILGVRHDVTARTASEVDGRDDGVVDIVVGLRVADDIGVVR